jgi:hypothetical protein
MHAPASERPIASARPPFLFVVGAPGSGNTLMFLSLVRDPHVYGVNEDAFGSTLGRLLRNDRAMGTCPHGVSRFVDFMNALRHDRATLVLKTPSNVRELPALREHLPGSRFICMIREPHAAVASGLPRHRQSAASVAHLWKVDMERVLDSVRDDVLIVPFEALVAGPGRVFEVIAERVGPLSPEVGRYASRMADPERAADAWWQRRIDPDTQREIRRSVLDLDLPQTHRRVLALAPAEFRDGVDRAPVRRPLDRLRRLLFRARYWRR